MDIGGFRRSLSLYIYTMGPDEDTKSRLPHFRHLSKDGLRKVLTEGWAAHYSLCWLR